MQPFMPSGFGPAVMRGIINVAPDMVMELLTPGRVLQAEVVSTFQDRAILSFGRGARLEVQVQVPLQEGQRIRVQVQPREPGTPVPDGRAPILLRLVGQTVPGQAQAAQLAQAPGEALQAATHQPGAAQQPGTAPQAQPTLPQLQWLPIPLPGGGQAWVQLVVQEEPPRKQASGTPGPVHHVRIWWETPGLGPVQVSMEAAGRTLSALFTTELAESRETLEQSLPALQERLAAGGFESARLGARQAAPGEPVEPVRQQEPGRIDRRL